MFVLLIPITIKTIGMISTLIVPSPPEIRVLAASSISCRDMKAIKEENKMIPIGSILDLPAGNSTMDNKKIKMHN